MILYQDWHVCIGHVTLIGAGKRRQLKLCSDLNKFVIGVEVGTGKGEEREFWSVSLRCWPLVLTLFWDY